MDGVFSAGKFKRKELDQVNEDFSDFSLSSPARKIRRLDAELLPPILEEEEPVLPAEFHQLELERNGGNKTRSGVVIEELPAVQDNEERALVLFKSHTPLMRSPTNYTVDPQFVSEFKNQAMWPNQRDRWRAVYGFKEEEEEEEDNDTGIVNHCRALVPWVPSQLPSVAENAVPAELVSGDMMEAEDTEAVTMDIEEGGDFEQPRGLNDAMPQWQQQHCLVPQPPENTTSPPVVWFQ